MNFLFEPNNSGLLKTALFDLPTSNETGKSFFLEPAFCTPFPQDKTTTNLEWLGWRVTRDVDCRDLLPDALCSTWERSDKTKTSARTSDAYDRTQYGQPLLNFRALRKGSVITGMHLLTFTRSYEVRDSSHFTRSPSTPNRAETSLGVDKSDFDLEQARIVKRQLALLGKYIELSETREEMLVLRVLAPPAPSSGGARLSETPESLAQVSACLKMSVKGGFAVNLLQSGAQDLLRGLAPLTAEDSKNPTKSLVESLKFAAWSDLDFDVTVDREKCPELSSPTRHRALLEATMGSMFEALRNGNEEAPKAFVQKVDTFWTGNQEILLSLLQANVFDKAKKIYAEFLDSVSAESLLLSEESKKILVSVIGDTTLVVQALVVEEVSLTKRADLVIDGAEDNKYAFIFDSGGLVKTSLLRDLRFAGSDSAPWTWNHFDLIRQMVPYGLKLRADRLFRQTEAEVGEGELQLQRQKWTQSRRYLQRGIELFDVSFAWSDDNQFSLDGVNAGHENFSVTTLPNDDLKWSPKSFFLNPKSLQNPNSVVSSFSGADIFKLLRDIMRCAFGWEGALAYFSAKNRLVGGMSAARPSAKVQKRGKRWALLLGLVLLTEGGMGWEEKIELLDYSSGGLRGLWEGFKGLVPVPQASIVSSSDVVLEAETALEAEKLEETCRGWRKVTPGKMVKALKLFATGYADQKRRYIFKGLFGKKFF